MVKCVIKNKVAVKKLFKLCQKKTPLEKYKRVSAVRLIISFRPMRNEHFFVCHLDYQVVEELLVTN